MEYKTNLSIRQKLRHLQGGSLIAIFIALSPLLFYIYLCFPKTKVWETFFFTYESHYYKSVSTFVWTLCSKLVPLLILLLLYFSVKKWWVNALLSVIGMYAFQIIVLISSDYFDELIDFKFLIPSIILVCIALYFMRQKMKFYINIIDLKEDIEDEIEKARKEIENERR